MARKIIIIVFALIVIGIIAAVAFGGRKESGTKVYTSEAKARTIQEVVSASGKIFPQTEVKISSDVSGEVVELYVEEGDSVVPNQLLAKIDADAYQSQVARGVAGVNSSKAQLANSKAQINSLEAQLTQIEAQISNARVIYDRNKTVSLLNVEQGERVVGTIQMTGTELMRIANLNAMEVRVEVSENDVPTVKIGNKVEVEVDAYLNRTFTGRVTQIANSSTTAGLADNVLNSDQVTNFEVRISIDPESYADLVAEGNIYPFRPGMSAGVDILTKSVEGIVSIPIEAVTTREKEVEDKEAAGTDNLQEVVFIVSADTVRQQVVTTGIQDANVIQVVTGLDEGDKVVSGPYTELSRKLKSGKKVIVKDKETFYSEDKD